MEIVGLRTVGNPRVIFFKINLDKANIFSIFNSDKILLIINYKYKPMEDLVSGSRAEGKNQISRKSFIKGIGTIMAAGGVLGVSRWNNVQASARRISELREVQPSQVAKRVAADPFKIPAPIHRKEARIHHVLLETKEMVGEIEPGVRFNYMTFGGQIPGPMIRVRQGDTVELTLKSNSKNHMIHNIDMHAVYGTGGGAAYTLVGPGQSKTIRFKAMYPGAFIYHCAVPNMDFHISSGMFGMIVVEPPQGLPRVDKEIYLGQNEVYTDKDAGQQGFHNFSFDNMIKADPTYVLLNGQKDALTKDVFGEIPVKQGERVRVFFVCGGPNLTSSFHPIGNIWHKAWPEGAIANNPLHYIQTQPVPPGSCGVFELELPIAQKIKLVDHALSRVTRKGMLGVIDVQGEENPEIFKPISS